MGWMLVPLRRYADFSGRSRRMEFWMFTLFRWIVFAALFAVMFAVLGGIGALSEMASKAGGPTSAAFGSIMSMGIVYFIVWLLLIIPYGAVVVRRFHDQDKSGWLGLLVIGSIIPYLGLIFTIVIWIFMCFEGTKGENRFGSDPKGENIADVFA
jgi:uncharacterized membrane protein YhaH (DUF805 family)